MALSPDALVKTIDDARDFLADRASPACGAKEPAVAFADALVQLASACVVGLPCERHGGAVHGQEAEELRAGVEQILRDATDMPEEEESSFAALLDRIDARDSLAFREATDDVPDVDDVSRRWQAVQRQLAMTRAAILHAGRNSLKDETYEALVPQMLIVELATLLAKADEVLVALLAEKRLACE